MAAQAWGFTAQMKLLLLWMALFVCASACAEADIELNVSLIGGNFVPPGAEGCSVEIRWVNHGPDAATNVYANTLNLLGPGQNNLIIIPNEQTPPCRVRRFCFDSAPYSRTLCSVNSFAEPSILQPGEEAVCIVGMVTSPDSPALIRQSFSYWRPDDDPNSSNNVSTLQVFTGNALTPVPTGGIVASMVLILGLLGFGLKRIRSRNSGNA